MILQRLQRRRRTAGRRQRSSDSRSTTTTGRSASSRSRPTGRSGDRGRPGTTPTSILLHLVNTLLVFLLARRLLGAEASVVAAAMFGLHVVNQEAVFWASARFDLLATAGALGTLAAARIAPAVAPCRRGTPLSRRPAVEGIRRRAAGRRRRVPLAGPAGSAVGACPDVCVAGRGRRDLRAVAPGVRTAGRRRRGPDSQARRARGDAARTAVGRASRNLGRPGLDARHGAARCSHARRWCSGPLARWR